MPVMDYLEKALARACGFDEKQACLLILLPHGTDTGSPYFVTSRYGPPTTLYGIVTEDMIEQHLFTEKLCNTSKSDWKVPHEKTKDVGSIPQSCTAVACHSFQKVV